MELPYHESEGLSELKTIEYIYDIQYKNNKLFYDFVVMTLVLILKQLERHIENLEKSHRREITNEMKKHAATKLELDTLQADYEYTKIHLRVRAIIYSSNHYLTFI